MPCPAQPCCAKAASGCRSQVTEESSKDTIVPHVMTATHSARPAKLDSRWQLQNISQGLTDCAATDAAERGEYEARGRWQNCYGGRRNDYTTARLVSYIAQQEPAAKPMVDVSDGNIWTLVMPQSIQATHPSETQLHSCRGMQWGLNPRAIHSTTPRVALITILSRPRTMQCTTRLQTMHDCDSSCTIAPASASAFLLN